MDRGWYSSNESLGSDTRVFWRGGTINGNIRQHHPVFSAYPLVMTPSFIIHLGWWNVGSFLNSGRSRIFDDCSSLSKASSASKAASSSNRRIKLLDNSHFWCHNLPMKLDMKCEQKCSATYSLDDKLGNPISLVNLKVLLSKVEQKDLDLATVIRVNDTCTSRNVMLDCQPRAGSNTAI